MGDPSDSGFDPLPLLPETPKPPPPGLGESSAAQSRGGVERGIRREPRATISAACCDSVSHNPFYPHACLVFWGLEKSFLWHGATPRPELLMSGLAGYALLLAAVGCLLIARDNCGKTFEPFCY